MLKNFLVLAFRNLLKRRLFSFINIFGLALGLAACLVILKYDDFETSFDNFHQHTADLFRMDRSIYQQGQLTASRVTSTYALGPTMQSQLPEIKRFVRYHPMYGGVVMSTLSPSGQLLSFREQNTPMVDSTFFRAFTFQSVEGDLTTSLDQPSNIVLTRAMAKKYFGDADPIGKSIKLSGGWCDGDYTVSAVMEDVPPNSHFQFDALLPLHNIFNSDQYQHDSGWGWNNFITYVELNPNASRTKLLEKLPDFSKKNIDIHDNDLQSKTVLDLQPIRDIHLHPGLLGDGETISRSTIYFFGLIALFILFIAWINYINLSTARAMERAHEVGIKKAIGALRSQLVRQFYLESFLVNFVGILLALGIAVELLPVLGSIIGKNLTFDFSDMRLWFTLGALLVFGTLVAGTYPALVLSSFRITEVLKGKRENRGFPLRKSLVVFQFAASLVLIAGTFLVYRQIAYMESHDKGLQMDQMLVVSGPSTIDYRQARQKLTIFKDEVSKLAGVENVATSGAIPGGGYNWGTYIYRSGAEENSARNGDIVWVDPDFIKTYHIQLIAGHNFNPSIKSDMQSVIINQACLQAFGLGTAEEALNESVVMGGDTVRILGVAKDFNWNSLQSEMVPFLLRADTVSTAKVSIHLAGGIHPETINKIGDLYKDLIPGEPFDYYFLDDFFNEQYRSEQSFGKIFGIFAILAIVIACLGLWGLASFSTAQRLREIGVRKVLGASTGGLVYLLLRQFLNLVLIASVIAIPLIWFGANSWLSGFAYRVGMRWDLFVIPVIILALIALVTVSVQVLKGATSNPARVLRSE